LKKVKIKKDFYVIFKNEVPEENIKAVKKKHAKLL